MAAHLLLFCINFITTQVARYFKRILLEVKVEVSEMKNTLLSRSLLKKVLM